MARSSANEPLEKFRFSISWTAAGATESEPSVLVRAGFHDAQLPKRSTNKGTYREGTDRDINQLFPGLSSMEDVVLSRGLLPNGKGTGANEFYKWMSAVHAPSDGNDTVTTTVRPAGAASHAYRKDVTITMLDREGAPSKQWILHNAWPTNFVPGSDLNAGEDGEKSLEQLTLAYEDFTEGSLADPGNGVAPSLALPASTPATGESP
jgi:phage tail-like protein